MWKCKCYSNLIPYLKKRKKALYLGRKFPMIEKPSYLGSKLLLIVKKLRLIFFLYSDTKQAVVLKITPSAVDIIICCRHVFNYSLAFISEH